MNDAAPNRPSSGGDQAAPFGVGLIAGLAVTLLILGGSALSSEAGDAQIRNTIRLSLAWYAAALLLMMRLTPADWPAETKLGRLARWCWTLAVTCYLAHFAAAFHYFHHWSHAHAFTHTQQVSGLGQGIYVSYLFTLVWAADAAWWRLRPRSYASRPAWIDVLLHGFMLFIVFNGAVVFASGAVRWVSLAMFVALILAWLRTRSARQFRLA